MHERGKVVAVLRERRGPQGPVELGVGLAIVERQAVAVLRFAVVGHFLFQHACGKRLRPSTRSHTKLYFWLQVPGLSNASRKWSPSSASFTQRAANSSATLRYSAACAVRRASRTACANAPRPQMAFAERLTLCARWPAKSSVQSWFSGSKPSCLRYFGPLLELRPIVAGEIGVAFDLGDRGHQDQQVAAFLDRHLVLLGALAAAIDLAVGLGIGAEIVRRERKLPAIAGRVIHERHDKRLGERRAEQQKLRRHRVEHVGRGDAAVGVILLAELKRLAVGVGDEFAGGKTLAVGERCNRGILVAAGAEQVGRQLFVELTAGGDQLLVIASGLDEQPLGVESVSSPVGPQADSCIRSSTDRRRRRSASA